MNKLNFVLVALTKVLEFFKGISCKIGMCCGGKCNSECGGKKEEDDDLKERYKGVKGLDGDKEDKDE